MKLHITRADDTGFAIVPTMRDAVRYAEEARRQSIARLRELVAALEEK